eukprot:CAMPEP_0196778438 /NCGR_PEP_ID=MMETSP1104-20130614/5798_1 /TAXON_ID=33652 /ORGANISM="Cafeteria sp., Strain Caron Lab Isolate" /LENGTH=59 /DNA_ID=CAMNT_0042148607 /DNA_START=28 /DNA_END=204 /DNA_ORIENTATION=-
MPTQKIKQSILQRQREHFGRLQLAGGLRHRREAVSRELRRSKAPAAAPDSTNTQQVARL